MSDESIFTEALAIANLADRVAYLDRVCAGNLALRRQVDELLAAQAESNVLDRSPVDLARTGAYISVIEDTATRARVGDRVGPYKLLEKIGEGGMGEVWVADQTEPIRRRVALKLIKPGMDSRSVLARFEAERQALAVMDHPNIAKVLDAGTTAEGRPYFVMELVMGTPITEFCDACKLTPKQRLELFVPVCQAIQHAHMKGIIHRDIKPSNVLVALHDDHPVPKVIDFGVAKAIGQQLTEKTIYTGFGALVGTPAYMAPEQATFNQLDIDTRADVYALGVLLYELLAGSPPIDPEQFKRAALDEVLRLVREMEPPRPSQRLSTSQTKAGLAATRQSDPDKLSALLRGELDWIVMKALEKDRARRYESANGFAADVQRYLAGEPVQAVPPSWSYQTRKWLRRNRVAVQVVSVVFLTLLAGIAGTTWQAIRASNQARVAADKSDEAREQERFARLAAEQASVKQREAEEMLCRGLLRPIGFRSSETEFDQAELNSFLDMAKLPSDQLRLLCIHEALRDPANSLRIARRADRLMQALVGADPVRREQVRAYLLNVQRDANADVKQRAAACWLEIALGPGEGEWAPAFEEAIIWHAKQDRADNAIDSPLFLTPTLLYRLDERRRGLLVGLLAKQLLTGENVSISYDAKWALKLILPHLTGCERTALAEQLIEGCETARYTGVMVLVAELLPAITPSLTAERADRLALPILERLQHSPKKAREVRVDREWHEHRLALLVAIAAQLSSPVADQLAQYVHTRNLPENSILSKADLIGSLRCLAATTPRNNSAVRKQTLQVLQRIVNNNEHFGVGTYAPELAALVQTLEADLDSVTAAKLAYDLALRNSFTAFSHDSREAIPRFAHVLLRRMDPKDTSTQAKYTWKRVVDWFVLGKTSETPSWSVDENDLKRVRWIAHVIPVDIATTLCQEYLARYQAKPDRSHHDFLAITFLAKRVDPKVAAEMTSAIGQILTTHVDLRDLDDMAKAYAALHAQQPADMKQTGHLEAWQHLQTRLTKATTETEAYYVMNAMLALAAGLSPLERAVGLQETVNQIMTRIRAALAADNSKNLTLLVQELADVAPMLDPTMANALVDEMNQLIAAHDKYRTLLWKVVAIVKPAGPASKRAMLRTILQKTRTLTKPSPATVDDYLNSIEACISGFDAQDDAPILRETFAAVQQFRDSLDSGKQVVCLESLLRLSTRMATADREPRQAELARRAIERFASSQREENSSVHLTIIRAMTNPRDLEKLLDHPACVWSVRMVVLERLRQIHDPEYRVLLTAGVIGAHANPLLGGAMWGEALVPSRPRFVTIQEYQAWATKKGRP